MMAPSVLIKLHILERCSIVKEITKFNEPVKGEREATGESFKIIRFSVWALARIKITSENTTMSSAIPKDKEFPTPTTSTYKCGVELELSD